MESLTRDSLCEVLSWLEFDVTTLKVMCLVSKRLSKLMSSQLIWQAAFLFHFSERAVLLPSLLRKSWRRRVIILDRKRDMEDADEVADLYPERTRNWALEYDPVGGCENAVRVTYNPLDPMTLVRAGHLVYLNENKHSDGTINQCVAPLLVVKVRQCHQCRGRKYVFYKTLLWTKQLWASTPTLTANKRMPTRVLTPGDVYYRPHVATAEYLLMEGDSQDQCATLMDPEGALKQDVRLPGVALLYQIYSLFQDHRVHSGSCDIIATVTTVLGESEITSVCLKQLTHNEGLF